MAKKTNLKRCVVMAAVVVVAIAVTTKYVVRAKNVVQIQVLIAAPHSPLAVKGIVAILLTRSVVKGIVVKKMKFVVTVNAVRKDSSAVTA